MARITVEDCLTKETNRFALVQLAAKRTKQLLQGGKLLIDDNRGNKPVVTSLREIAAGKVRFMTRLEEEEARNRELEEAERRSHMSSPAPVNGGAIGLIADSRPVAAPIIADDSENGSHDGSANSDSNGSSDKNGSVAHIGSAAQISIAPDIGGADKGGGDDSEE